jgi:predicted nucleic acid-binding protein
MILLDANILLEILISGRPCKTQVIKWIENNPKPFCISMLTVHLVLYFGLKDNLSISDIKIFLEDYTKIS